MANPSPKPKKRDHCTAAPDWLPSVGYIGDACARHDWRYSKGGTENDRAEADFLLRRDILRAGRERSKGFWAAIALRKLRSRIVAEIYYIAVWLRGASYFNYHTTVFGEKMTPECAAELFRPTVGE